MKSTLRSFVQTVFFMLLCQSLSAYDFEADGIYYDIMSQTELTVKVTKKPNSCYSGNISIPSSVTYSGNTYSVTSIGDGAFYTCSGLTCITIPNNVTNIGDYAFYACSGLTSITIPSSTTSIGDEAFRYSGLTSITLPNGLTSIGVRAFSCCALTDIAIPSSVTSIGNYAFSDCTNLQYNEYDSGLYLGNEANPYFALIANKSNDISNIDINVNCRFILDEALAYCSKLTNITIPNNVISIGDRAFYNCI